MIQVLGRLLRSTRGQSAAIVALFLSFAGVVLLTGALGVGLAIAQKARLQDAADAAALAAAREVRPSTTIVVRRYDRVCERVYDNRQQRWITACQDSVLPETITLDGRAMDLLPDRWLREADCDGRLDDPSMERPGRWTVCEWGSTEKTDWSLAADRARAVAVSYLQENLQGQTFKTWRMTSFRVNTSRPMPVVELEVEAEAINPVLQAVVGHPVNMKVLAWADSVDRTLPEEAR